MSKEEKEIIGNKQHIESIKKIDKEALVKFITGKPINELKNSDEEIASFCSIAEEFLYPYHLERQFIKSSKSNKTEKPINLDSMIAPSSQEEKPDHIRNIRGRPTDTGEIDETEEEIPADKKIKIDEKDINLDLLKDDEIQPIWTEKISEKHQRYALAYDIIKMFIYMEQIFKANNMDSNVNKKTLSEEKDSPQKRLAFLKIARNIVGDYFHILSQDDLYALFQEINDFCACKEFKEKEILTLFNRYYNVLNAHVGKGTDGAPAKSTVFFDAPKRAQEQAKAKNESFEIFANQTFYFLNEYSAFIKNSKCVIRDGNKLYNANDVNYRSACMAFLAAATCVRNFKGNYFWIKRIKAIENKQTLLTAETFEKEKEINELVKFDKTRDSAHKLKAISNPEELDTEENIKIFKESVQKILNDIFGVKKNIDVIEYSKKDKDGDSPRAISFK